MELCVTLESLRAKHTKFHWIANMSAVSLIVSLNTDSMLLLQRAYVKIKMRHMECNNAGKYLRVCDLGEFKVIFIIYKTNKSITSIWFGNGNIDVLLHTELTEVDQIVWSSQNDSFSSVIAHRQVPR